MNLLACKTLLLRPKPERITKGKKVKYIVAAICQKKFARLIVAPAAAPPAANSAKATAAAAAASCWLKSHLKVGKKLVVEAGVFVVQLSKLKNSNTWASGPRGIYVHICTNICLQKCALRKYWNAKMETADWEFQSKVERPNAARVHLIYAPHWNLSLGEHLNGSLNSLFVRRRNTKKNRNNQIGEKTKHHEAKTNKRME